jgi:NAD(P)-dependent dehydrogenase (short-subunit alcohol dehydrogenase family)
MARVVITGSADGLGRLAALTLLDDGHEVVVHARNSDRLTAVRDLVDRGAAAVVGDLSDLEETRGIARDVNRLGRMDAVIHNFGVYTGPQVLPVNIVAPYLLTALIERPQRLAYLSSSEHRSGRASLTSIDWSGQRPGTYPDSKLFVTTLAVVVAQLWADVFSNGDARTSGGCWHHQRRIEPHRAVRDRRFQDQLLDDLARFTATRLVSDPGEPPRGPAAP